MLFDKLNGRREKYITLESQVIVIGICSKTILTSIPDRVTFKPVKCWTGMGISFFVVNIFTCPPVFSNVNCSFCRKTSNECGQGWVAPYGHARKITLNVPSVMS